MSVEKYKEAVRKHVEAEDYLANISRRDDVCKLTDNSLFPDLRKVHKQFMKDMAQHGMFPRQISPLSEKAFAKTYPSCRMDDSSSCYQSCQHRDLLCYRVECPCVNVRTTMRSWRGFIRNVYGSDVVFDEDDSKTWDYYKKPDLMDWDSVYIPQFGYIFNLEVAHPVYFAYEDWDADYDTYKDPSIPFLRQARDLVKRYCKLSANNLFKEAPTTKQWQRALSYDDPEFNDRWQYGRFEMDLISYQGKETIYY